MHKKIQMEAKGDIENVQSNFFRLKLMIESPLDYLNGYFKSIMDDIWLSYEITIKVLTKDRLDKFIRDYSLIVSTVTSYQNNLKDSFLFCNLGNELESGIRESIKTIENKVTKLYLLEDIESIRLRALEINRMISTQMHSIGKVLFSDTTVIFIRNKLVGDLKEKPIQNENEDYKLNSDVSFDLGKLCLVTGYFNEFEVDLLKK